MTTFDLDALEALPILQTKAELLERIPPARRSLEDLVASLDDAQMSVPGDGGWTVRDHLSHVAAWERMLVAHITRDTAGKVPEAMPPESTLEEINTRIYERHRDDAPDAVAAEFAAAYQSIMTLIARLSDDDLASFYWDDDDRTVIDKLTGGTYQHYLEHRRWIGELMASGAPS